MFEGVRRRRSLALSLVAALCAPGGALCALGGRADPVSAADSPAPPSRQRSLVLGRASLVLDAPAPGERLRQSKARVRVRGRAGAELYGVDLVIALDASNSALLASGVDLDADGVVGVTREFAENRRRFSRSHHGWTTDSADTILRAELVAARAVIEALARRENRIGLLTFTSEPGLRAWVGSPERAAAAVGNVQVMEDRTGTDVARALRRSAILLEQAGSGRPRAILLGSDGEPTVPGSRYNARQSALTEARRLAERGIALYVLGFGAHLRSEDGEDDLEFLRELAEAGRGVFVEVDAPAQLLRDLPPVQEQLPALEIENRTTGESLRGVRPAPDGVFEAWLAVAPGANELRVRASWPDGRGESQWRTLHYEAVAAGGSVAAVPEPEIEESE